MSTKYYGYRLKNTKMEDVLRQLQSCFNDCNELFQKSIQKKFVQYLYKSFDNALINKSKAKEMEIWDLASNYNNYVFQVGSTKNKVYNFEICLFPYKKDVLIMNYSDYIYRDIINQFAWEDYSYWNNTDKPENVSNKEWNNRCKIWETVCYDAPANCSLRYNPFFNSHKNYAFFWKYEDLKDVLAKYNPVKRLEIYRKDNDFVNDVMGKNIPFKFANIKPEDMISITQDNFKNKFLAIPLKENEVVFN